MREHIHMCLSIPLQLAVSNVVGYLKGKVQYPLPVTLKGDNVILPEKLSGLEDILYQQSGWMKKWFENIFETKKSKMSIESN